MKPLRVRYSRMWFGVMRTDEAVMCRSSDANEKTVCRLLEKIENGSVNCVTIIGRHSLNGWRLFTSRDVVFGHSDAVPADDEEVSMAKCKVVKGSIPWAVVSYPEEQK